MVTKTVAEIQSTIENYLGDYKANCPEITKVDFVRESSIRQPKANSLEDVPDNLCLHVTLSKESSRTMRLPGLYEGVKVFYKIVPKANKSWTIIKKTPNEADLDEETLLAAL